MRMAKGEYIINGYIIWLQDDPEVASKGMWQVLDKNLRIVEFTIGDTIEALFTTKHEAIAALKTIA